MLERLFIKNFALIEELSVDFSGSLNVLTGETGTGKSIIIDAVSVLLGTRAQTEFIRSGSEKASLEAVFCLTPKHPVHETLQSLGVEDEEPTIILTRELYLNGRNICRVNGRTVSLAQYRTIGLQIVDIHGQHDHQSLLQSEKHLDVLDRFGGTEHIRLVRENQECYAIWHAAKKELEELRSREQERLQRIDFLSYQIAEIKRAGLKPGELEELMREANLLANAEKINTRLQSAYYYLFGGERGISAYELVGKALGDINELRKIDSDLEKLGNQLEPGLYVIEETAGEIRNYLENLEYSPQRLEEVENRLQQIKDLCKKYGPAIGDVLNFFETAEAELAKWETSLERAEKLEHDVNTAWHIYEEKAGQLTKKRKELGAILENRVIAQLTELAMPHARFSVSLLTAEPTHKGLDEVEFLISPNPGEPLLPVAKIASGGELSRIMLALKTILADIDGIGTLVFDEIDSGIGGLAAQKVAEKLEKISESQQVICVTHSPIIAALADCHLLLDKVIELGRTKTLIRYLNDDERVDELVRMLAGDKQTEDLKRHALKIIKRNK